ncbi:MAG: helicase-related protein [Muribaculaceae bacterium]|nr:helicase-related protein [Muribaculaceae bacterium]
MEIIDNIHKNLKDDLLTEIKANSRLSIAASCFSIYAFQELKDKFKEIKELRFIFTSPTFITEKADKQKREFYIPRLNRERNLYGSEFEIKLRNELSQKAIAKECAEWIKEKVCFKSNQTDANMMGFINIDETNYMPINGFTTVELGCEQGKDAYTMINKSDFPYSQSFLTLFDQIWNDTSKMQVVTQEVIDNITNAYKENAPDFIYFVTLYNIFNEFLEDISEDVLPNEATGFKSSVIWNKLYNFQKDAALAIINKLEKFNGCILADSVGLGKTFTALSVIKYYENRNKSVLVLCPKKLNDNWQTFRSNYKNNPIASDRLRYDVLFHTDLTRESGKSNGLSLENINWGNYDLIVIDESHNFRNGGNFEDEEAKDNRYTLLMNNVIRRGVKTKVLMLSATPVNNRFNDLKNQIQLAYEGNSANINNLLDTNNSIDDIFRLAQRAYNQWSKLEPIERTTQKLLDSLSFDFFQILDSVTIARSRSHIAKYYDTTDIGKFPKRLKPKSPRPVLTDLTNSANYKDIANILFSLNLAIYTPSAYILPSAKANYDIDFGETSNLSIDWREKGLRKLMSINLLKRLESSVNSFRLTILRIHKQLKLTVDSISEYEKTHKNATFDSFDIAADFEVDYDSEDTESDVFVGGRKSQVNLKDLDYISWKRDLILDLEKINLLLDMIKPITPEHDSKLAQLISDLKDKFANPLNGDNKKVLIFTAFSDTADYLYNNLAQKIKAQCGLNVALITGNTEGKCTIPHLKSNFNTILTLFSPISKDCDKVFSNISDRIDVLIATDCISEGQNLQDCDFLINYDIHWNPVRIIQRFGRIDRIGSKNEVIQLVNYWPDIDLDDYIQLKGRVESKMKATVLTSTGDDNLLSANEKGDLEYRKSQLERLKTEVVDIEDMDTGINIMDLGLNEFRLDLLAYMNEHHDIEHSPLGMSAVVGSTENAKPGVIYILKNRNNGVNIGKTNLLHPFYMVYMTDYGEVICDHLSPKKLLDTMRHTCKGKTEPIMELCRQINKETRDGRNMKHYSELLHKAIDSIVEVKEESDIDSFLNGVQGSLFNDEIKGLDDFELICFLVIK